MNLCHVLYVVERPLTVLVSPNVISRNYLGFSKMIIMRTETLFVFGIFPFLYVLQSLLCSELTVTHCSVHRDLMSEILFLLRLFIWLKGDVTLILAPFRFLWW